MLIAGHDAAYSDAVAAEGLLEMLGALEFAGCGVAAVLLVIAVVLRPQRRVARRVLWGIVIVLALTLAQPFGYASTELRLDEAPSAPPLRALPGERLDTRQWHAVRVLGMPVGVFRLGEHTSTYLDGEGYYGSHMLKVRTFLPPPLTNGTTVCGYRDGDCIDERDAAVELTREGSTLHIRTTRPAIPFAGDEPGALPAEVREFRLTLGVPSKAGVWSWILLAIGAALTFVDPRRGPHAGDDADDAAPRPADGTVREEV